MTTSYDKGAVISPCGTYRYRLWRIWAPEKPRALFIMLNPSTADARVDDPTIRRCISFAKREDCGGIEVVNLYAYRATSPRDMFEGSRLDIVGPDNEKTLRALLGIVEGPVICAWGAHGDEIHEDQIRTLAGDKPLYHLGLTKQMKPRHPLYIHGDAPLVQWLAPGEEEALDEDLDDMIGPIVGFEAFRDELLA